MFFKIRPTEIIVRILQHDLACLSFYSDDINTGGQGRACMVELRRTPLEALLSLAVVDGQMLVIRQILDALSLFHFNVSHA